MNIDLVKIQESDKSVLRQLMELYLHDFSVYDNADVNEHGFYGYNYLDAYWTEPNRHPYFIKVEDKLAGFVLVSNHTAVLESGSGRSISEFFVMRKYRGLGVGKMAACLAFGLFPGRWEVRQYLPNVPALNFWEKVIGAYTQGDFKKQLISVEDWEEQAIIFDNQK